MDLNLGKCCGSRSSKVCSFFFLDLFQFWSFEMNDDCILFFTIMQKESWRSVLLLAYQSLGVVYGDLSISPLYVFKSTFAEDIQHSETNEEIYGVMSFVFWTLTLVPLLKYVFIVLRADDNGEGERKRLSETRKSLKKPKLCLLVCLCSYVAIFSGGTFALYSLICRHVKVSLLPNRQVSDEALSTYKLEHPPEKNHDSCVKRYLEKHKWLHTALLLLVLLGTCMVIGDGLLTPAISGMFCFGVCI